MGEFSADAVWLLQTVMLCTENSRKLKLGT